MYILFSSYGQVDVSPDPNIFSPRYGISQYQNNLISFDSAGNFRWKYIVHSNTNDGIYGKNMTLHGNSIFLDVQQNGGTMNINPNDSLNPIIIYMNPIKVIKNIKLNNYMYF